MAVNDDSIHVEDHRLQLQASVVSSVGRHDGPRVQARSVARPGNSPWFTPRKKPSCCGAARASPPQAGGAEQYRLFGDLHVQPVTPLREGAANRVEVGVQVDQDLVDSRPAADFEPDLEHRYSTNGYQTLRNPVRQRPQAGAVARG